MDPHPQKPLRIDAQRPARAALEEAASVLRRGGLIVMPTETVYGLAGDPRIAGVSRRMYEAKGRPYDKPLPLLAADTGQILAFGVCLDGVAGALAKKFWPGPLTLVLNTPAGFLGFRVPGYAPALDLLRHFGCVLAVTSANRSGEPPALTAGEAARALAGSVALVLDAGPSPGGKPSTVAKVDGSAIEILREGAIPSMDLFETA